MKRRILVAFAVNVLSLLLLAGCGKKNEAPAAYTIGENEVISLDSIMDAGTVVLTSIEKPTEAAIELGMEEYTYRYKQADDPIKLAASYVGVLRSAEQGFVLTDSENREIREEPVFEQPTGSVMLGKALVSEEEEEEAAAGILRVIVAWSEFSVAIQVSHQEGEILPPLEPETEETDASEPTAISEQIDYFSSLSPSLLGLPGDSMEEYRIYPVEGWVRVNGVPCRQMNVYLLDLPESTNTFLGTYYLSSDLTELYQKTSTGSITSIDLG